MSQIPDDLKYSREHEWVSTKDGLSAVCGITDHAQELLTDIVFVELPDVGIEVKQGEKVAVVESVKAVSDVYSPVSGKIAQVNKALEDAPELLNSDPYGDGWIFIIDIKHKNELEGLMDAKAYEEFVESGD